MKWTWIGLLILGLATGFWFGRGLIRNSNQRVDGAGQVEATHVIRLGLAPEQDIFRERKGYRGLGDYLEKKLGDVSAGSSGTGGGYRVELKTASSYAAVLKDFEEGKIDAAFMGSLLAAVTMDRYHGVVVLKSEGDLGLSTYSGVVFVLDKSPAKRFEDLRGKRLGAVRTTLGGAVFPLYLMTQSGMGGGKTGANEPELVWSGTHDDVIREVAAGNLDAGAVKDLRLLAYEKFHPDVHFRILAESVRVPNNALVLRGDFPAKDRDALVNALLAMDRDSEAAVTLKDLNIRRYVPCESNEYDGLYRLLAALGPRWNELQIEGPVPQIRKEPLIRAAEGR